jgi:type VI protein secretion system component VasK
VTKKVPNLLRETGAVAWFLGKIVLCTVMVWAAVAWGFGRSTTTGFVVAYALLFIGLTLYLGWYNYRWQKQRWEREQKEEAEEKRR